MNPIIPTVGHVVLFRGSVEQTGSGGEVPGLITKVHSDNCINVSVHRDGWEATPVCVTSVSYNDDPDTVPLGASWRWMPYQISTAPKTVAEMDAANVAPKAEFIAATCADSASLAASEALSAKGATHPRVSLADMEAAISCEHYLNAGAACLAEHGNSPASLDLMTLCFLTMANGFVVVGKSAPASPENFDADKGRIFAREDAIRQLWPLMGFSLRDRLTF